MPNTLHRPPLTEVRTLSDFTWSRPRYPAWLRLAILFAGSGIGWLTVFAFAVEIAALVHSHG